MSWIVKKEKSKGITLIALVITIIVLLILAGISIAMLTGNNGLLTKAGIASEETKKATYKEVLELIGMEIRPEKILENLGTKEFMDRYQGKIDEEIKKGDILKGATQERKNDETIHVTTEEGWVYKITEDKVELLGKKGENPAPDLQDTDIELETNPGENTYTKGNVKVKIIVANPELKKYILQYSRNAQSWSNYTGEFEVTENGPIYARLINELDEEGAAASKMISNIDREDPNEAEVTFSPTSTDTDNSITATVTQSDNKSGVAITSCKWDYRKSNQEIGTNEADYKGGTFKSNPEPITLQTYLAGTYYLHILTIDNAGNKKETIKGPIEVTQGSYQEIFSDIYTKTETYTDENGKTARIPEGFAVGVTPGINKVDNGLVITDQIDANHRSTGNEFVWVPVPSKANFKSIDGYGMNKGGLQGVIKDVAEPCQNATQDAIDDYTAMCENVTSEKNKGFYIGRYETGKENNQAVVKKNKTVYNNIMWGKSFTDFSGGAIEKGKEFVKTTYTNKGKKVGVTSSLVYGVQWDATMQFFDNNYINGNCATNSYVRYAGTQGNFSGTLKETGSSDDYKVKNIYDMAGNYFEWTLESCHFAYGEHNPVHRGGDAMTNNNVFGASHRIYNAAKSVRSQSCRIPYCPLFSRLIKL